MPFLAINDPPSGQRDFAGFLAVFILAPFAAAWLYYLYLRFEDWRWERAFRRQPRRPNPFQVGESRRLVLTPQSISVFVAGETQTEPWSAVERIAASDDHAFLITKGAMDQIIPRRVFPTDTDFKRFVDTAKRYYEDATGRIQN
jgi:hypothetical protein